MQSFVLELAFAVDQYFFENKTTHSRLSSSL